MTDQARSSVLASGLDPVRPPRAVGASDVVHVLGAAGAGASAAALLAAASGARVTACDAGGPSPYSAALEAAGIPIAWSHDPAHVAGDPAPTRLAVTKALTALAPDHPELGAARAAGIPIESWQQVVADAAVGRTLVAVAGTHGKSTTAGWLVHLLAEAGRDPGAFVGALLAADGAGARPSTARVGAGAEFVVEADEYAGNFDAFRPRVAVVTSIEWDHPDVFPDRAAVIAAVRGWIDAMTEGWPAQDGADRDGPAARVLVANVGDPGVAELIDGLRDAVPATAGSGSGSGSGPGPGLSVVRIAVRVDETIVAADADITARIIDAGPRSTMIEVRGLDGTPAPIRVALPTAGRHNVANALGVAGAAAVLGVDPASIVSGLETFPGVGRRLEWKGEAGNVAVYDDYAHHPTAIVETIRAARQREPGRRVWAVYEPLTYHRTAALHDEFADALATADAVAVARIWAGRDIDTTVDSAEALAASVIERRPGIPVGAPGDVDDTAAWLAGQVRASDVVLVMGGGRSYRIGERLLELLEGD